jgi:hypothetical protein
MDNSIQIQKTVYNKEEVVKVLDRNFNTFKTPVEETSNITVQEFFDNYEELYYEIPAEGDTASHSYLVRKSSEILNIQNTNEDIQPLLDEISQLREQLLIANKQILDLQTATQ